MQHTLQCLVRVAHYGSKSFEYVHPNLQSSLAIKFLYTNWDLEKNLPVHTNCSLKRTTFMSHTERLEFRGNVLTWYPLRHTHSPPNLMWQPVEQHSLSLQVSNELHLNCVRNSIVLTIYVHPNLQSSLAIKFLYTNWKWRFGKKNLPVHTNCSLKRTIHVTYRKAWI